MKSLIMIIVASALIQNVVLNQFLGICSFLGVSKQMKASASLGVAVIFVITIAIVLLASIRGRIREEDIPAPLRGAPIVLISAALMSIAFLGFSGLSF